MIYVLIERIYPKSGDAITSYHNFHYIRMCLKIAGWVPNSVDPDHTFRCGTSDQDLH